MSNARLQLERVSKECGGELALEASAILLEHDDARYDRRLSALTSLGWMALITTLALTAMCCAAPQRMSTRTVAESHEASIRITETCLDGGGGVGTGVITSASTVLTARHVVDGAIERGCMLLGETMDGELHVLMPVRDWKDRDVAELMSLDDLPTTPITIAKVPPAGEYVCVVAAYPRMIRRCGDVMFYRADPPGDVIVDIVVEPGNSGSGVYDAHGRLVGITTHLYSCRNGQWCGGKFASLEFLLAPTVKP